MVQNGSILVRQEVFLISYGDVTRYFGEMNPLSRRKPVKRIKNKRDDLYTEITNSSIVDL